MLENQCKEEHEYTLTGWCLWKNIKEMLFKKIYKENKEVEQLLDYALDLYKQSNCQSWHKAAKI